MRNYPQAGVHLGNSHKHPEHYLSECIRSLMLTFFATVDVHIIYIYTYFCFLVTHKYKCKHSLCLPFFSGLFSRHLVVRVKVNILCTHKYLCELWQHSIASSIFARADIAPFFNYAKGTNNPSVLRTVVLYFETELRNTFVILGTLHIFSN